MKQTEFDKLNLKNGDKIMVRGKVRLNDIEDFKITIYEGTK